MVFEDSHQYSSHSRPTRCSMVHEPSSFQDSTSQKFSIHNTITLSTVRLLSNKMIMKEKLWWTGDYWQVDPLRRELIRHHKDKRMNLHEMTRSEKTPIPKDQLLDERETHIEFQKSKKKVLHKDNWRTEKKRFF